MHSERIAILGAAGRDFHNFNVVYRHDTTARVVAFTATQIPGIAERRYPPALAGLHCPAGFVAAKAAGAATIVDPPPVRHRRPARRLRTLVPVLSAVGYDAAQRAALRETIDRADADIIVAATPVDLARLIAPRKPVVRARYEFADGEDPSLATLVDRWMARTPRAV
jgi:predicted GTPase